ncbi:hypothetical protein [Methylobacterium sp.]|uniref:hypothetical protein n=1 Tax=Methylobacterium sp. TaxID=409 RepID=UPI003D0F5000
MGAIEMRRLAATEDLPGLALVIAVMDETNENRIDAEARRELRGQLDGTSTAPTFPLSGGDLITAGIPPGRSVGRGLSASRSLWLERGCLTGEEERALLLDHAVTHARSGD